MTIPLNIGGSDGLDIQTRVVLKNETSHTVLRPGMAGKVTLIGSFPSADQEIHAVTSYAEYLATYNITNPKLADQYDAHRAIKRIFMEGMATEVGASSVTCININTEYNSTNTIDIESREDLEEQMATVESDIARYRQSVAELRIRVSNEQRRIEELSAKPTLTSNEQAELERLTLNLDDDIPALNDAILMLKNAQELYTKYLTFEGYLSNANGVVKINSEQLLTFSKLKKALKMIADDDTDILFISSDLHDCVIGGKSDAEGTNPYTDEQAPNLGVVYDTLLDFIDNEYTNHRPLTYIGFIRTAQTESSNATVTGIPTDKIQIDSGKVLDSNKSEEDYGVGYGDTDWGAKQIATLFTRENNELATAGLFYQGGRLNGENIGSMELAAHMCGWVAGKNVGDDLTYDTIPGLTSINDELFFQKGDAGTLLNNYGIQVIRPKDRLEKTFYVNNSIMPTGWHTNHVRSVIYLLKKYEFEAGLGINNIVTNVEAFRTNLMNVSKEVMKEVEVIRSVTLGEIEVINNYHLYIPVDIVLAGVVTKISVGVSMSIDEEGNAGTTLTTTGYNFYYQEA